MPILPAGISIRTQDWHALGFSHFINAGQYYQPLFYSAQGEIEFYISLTQEWPDELKGGVARFEGVADVVVHKLNPFILCGTVPRKYQ